MFTNMRRNIWKSLNTSILSVVDATTHILLLNLGVDKSPAYFNILNYVDYL